MTKINSFMVINIYIYVIMNMEWLYIYIYWFCVFVVVFWLWCWRCFCFGCGDGVFVVVVVVLLLWYCGVCFGGVLLWLGCFCCCDVFWFVMLILCFFCFFCFLVVFLVFLLWRWYSCIGFRGDVFVVVGWYFWGDLVYFWVCGGFGYIGIGNIYAVILWVKKLKYII